ncbi:FUSC family protein [Streptomyces laurentii]|uniref:FUSC family protein n=1 Tax=Streptomyces laurentii TaxID=39478 RepID=UPI00369C53A5
MSWLRALKETARSGLTIERRRLEPLIALRGAFGLALVVGFSLTLFGPEVAVSSAFGAFQAAIATFQHSYRPRPTLALASGASLAVSTFIGYLVGWNILLFMLLLALWTFLGGMSWAVGPNVGVIAASNVAMMLITVTLPGSLAAAAGHAAMIAVGGLVQAGLVVLLPIRAWGAQRDALADALAAEADYARRLRHDPTADFDPLPLMTARSAAAVTRRQARSRPAELHGARGLAERIRPVLASLADPALGVPAEGPQRDRARELLAAAGEILDAAAHAIRHGEPVELRPAALAVLRTPDTGAILTGAPRRAAHRLAALLDDVVEEAEPGGEVTSSGLRRPTLVALVPVAIRTARAELRHESPILRHAVRVTTVATVGYALGTVLPLGHGYWAPMASVMVMRPDFSQTFERSVARFIGTFVGVALASVIVEFAHPGAYPSALLAVVCAFGMYLLMRTGYVMGQVFISAYVVFLLGMGGAGLGQTVRERVLLTILGGLLAMLAYAVYPAWETPRLRSLLGDWLKADGRYAAAVVAHYAEPAGPALADVRETLLATRAARIAWQEAQERATHEPVRHRSLSHTAAQDTEEAVSQFGRAAMLLEAHLPERGAPPVPEAAALAEALRKVTERGAKEVRDRKTPRWNELRALVEAWERGEGAPDHFLLRKGAVLLLEKLDEVSEALDG